MPRKNYSRDYTEVKDASGKLKEIIFMPSTIETIDQAFFNWVDEVINPSSTTNKGFKKVPVIWISAERAYQIKNDKSLRDSNGVLKLPLLIVNRTEIVKDPAFKGVAFAHIPNMNDGLRGPRGGALTVARRINQEKTSNFVNADSKRKFGTISSATTGHGQENFPFTNPGKVVYETITMPMPVYVSVTYDIIVRTNYQQQLNEITTPFMTVTGQINNFFINHEGHRFEGFIQNEFQQSLDVTGEEESSYEAKMQFKILGYLLGGGINEERPKIAIRENAVQIRMPRERVIVGDVPQHNSKKGVKTFYKD
tara:strand:+ start:2711 stop:3637 length:927 start_codon:yes stop_codon:yes gene_type:complete